MLYTIWNHTHTLMRSIVLYTTWNHTHSCGLMYSTLVYGTTHTATYTTQLRKTSVTMFTFGEKITVDGLLVNEM